MRRTAASLLLLSGLAAGACAEPAPLVTTTRLEVFLPADRACRPAMPPTQLEVRALGDLPAAETDRFIELLQVDAPEPIDRFPPAARMVTVRSLDAWEAGGSSPLADADAVAPVLLLPFGRSCVLADPEVRAPAGSSLVALPDGGLLVLGGVSAEGDALRRVVRMPPPGGGLAAVLSDDMQFRRTGATATRVGDRIVVAGGGDADGGAWDTYEVFDAAAGRFDRDASGTLPGERRDHGAVALDDGTVLLVGGRERVGDPVPLATAVLVELGEGARPAAGTLDAARLSPQVLQLDDGRIFVAGGLLSGGAIPTTVEWFDPATEELATVAADLPPRAGAVAVALPGARLVWLGGDSAAVDVLSFAETSPLAPERETIVLSEPLPAVAPEEVTVLADGDVRVADAFVVDVGTGRLRRVESATAHGRSLRLADGTLAELSDTGASLRREQLRTQFDNPPATLLPSDTSWLAYDAAARWDGGLARGDALVHLPTLRFGDVAIVSRFDGPADLSLRDARGTVVRVVLDSTRTEVGLCRLEHPAGTEVAVVRSGGALALRAGDVERRCTVSLEGSVSLSWKALRGTQLVSLQIERL